MNLKGNFLVFAIVVQLLVIVWMGNADVVPTIHLEKQTVFVPFLEIKVEKVDVTVIEKTNNYSENTTLRTTVVYSVPHPQAGNTIAEFYGNFIIEEISTPRYYDGNNGAILIPSTGLIVSATNGTATFTIKSVSNYQLVSGPPNAVIKVSIDPVEGPNVSAGFFSVDQWVDENSNSFIDWLEQQSRDILECFKRKSTEAGTMARSATSMTQLEVDGSCGTTPVETTEIFISPVSIFCVATPGGHRWNADNQLSSTIIHEARHAWVNQELKRNDIGVNNDGDSATPSNDDDQDRWGEIMGPYPDTTDIIEGAAGVAGYPGSTNDNNPDPDPTFTTQELDAEDFGNVNRYQCR